MLETVLTALAIQPESPQTLFCPVCQSDEVTISTVGICKGKTVTLYPSGSSQRISEPCTGVTVCVIYRCTGGHSSALVQRAGKIDTESYLVTF